VERASRLDGKSILLGVSGSIAAYKAADIVRRLREQGADVRVVMTNNAARFVSRLTFEALSEHPVPDGEFQEEEQSGIGHIDITNGLDIALVAPATANIIGKLASGIADDTLTTTLMAIDCPLIVAPAMNDRMYRNQVVQKNIAFLKERGVHFVNPGTGPLACGTVGQGRLAEVDRIIREVSECLSAGDYAGVKVLVTAGPTREHIDAVRFISNPSTGKMGYALAAAAHARGATVTLISGPCEIEPPRGVATVRVRSAADMHKAVLEHLPQADIVIMAAAVSDFKPAVSFDRKIKKQHAPTHLELDRTDDILSAAGRAPGKRMLVGFAAETDDLVENAGKKMKDKNLDMIVANNILEQGAGFGADTNHVIILDRSGAKTDLPLSTKTEIAAQIMEKILELKKK
jgi:phosphopantothenoylcysteine decarboxylase/phosphopantothenate--cysteine ligase